MFINLGLGTLSRRSVHRYLYIQGQVLYQGEVYINVYISRVGYSIREKCTSIFIYLVLGTLSGRSVHQCLYKQGWVLYQGEVHTNVFTSKVGYSTKEKCTEWPREVCTVNKQLKKKNNPTTKCEKVKALFIRHKSCFMRVARNFNSQCYKYAVVCRRGILIVNCLARHPMLDYIHIQVPQELCGPPGCGFVSGPEVCHEQIKTIVTDLPNETCDIQPRTNCK